MTQPDRPWFRKRRPNAVARYDLASWQGAAVLGAFVLLIIPPVVILMTSGSLLLAFLIAIACAVGGGWWLVRMIRAHGVPDA